MIKVHILFPQTVFISGWSLLSRHRVSQLTSLESKFILDSGNSILTELKGPFARFYPSLPTVSRSVHQIRSNSDSKAILGQEEVEFWQTDLHDNWENSICRGRCGWKHQIKTVNWAWVQDWIVKLPFFTFMNKLWCLKTCVFIRNFLLTELQYIFCYFSNLHHISKGNYCIFYSTTAVVTVHI